MKILIDGQTLETEEINRGIGVYFKNVLSNMMKQRYEHTWYITVSDRRVIEKLEPWVQAQLIVIQNKSFMPTTNYSQSDCFTERLNAIIKYYGIDAMWIPNPLMVNVLFPSKELVCPCICTVYDLIPVVMPITDWPESVQNEYNRRLECLKSENYRFLFISNATKSDFERFVTVNSNSQVTMLGADSKLFYCSKTTKKIEGTQNEITVVFTGGFDYRKNLEGAVKALARIKQIYGQEDLVGQIRLYIVCKCSDETKQQFEQTLEQLNIKEQVVITGYLPDEELAELYSRTDVFFFPSLYEGFGLPLIEAMLGGAYVVSANNSSLPEVCGEYGLLFDANDIDDMAKTLYNGILESKNESVEKKRDRQNYALEFSWDKTAKQSIEFFESIFASNCDVDIKKEKIAIVTPWPNHETGIANFIYQLVPYLYKYFYIDIYTDYTIDLGEGEILYSNNYGELYDINELGERIGTYKEIIYQIGNNAQYHKKVYEMLCKYPGIAEIHDFVLHPFFYHAFYNTENEEIYKEALEKAYGEFGLRHYDGIVKKEHGIDIVNYPMSHAVCRIAKKVILHNHWSERQLVNTNNVHVIPLFCFQDTELEQDEAEVNAVLNKYGITDEIVIGCFGWLNSNKRPEVIINTIEQLIKKGKHVKLVFWGKCNAVEIEKMIWNKGIADNVTITGFLNKKEYIIGLRRTDIVVNLRYPSMGESSATLVEAMQYKKPIIVSDHNQYQEFPDEVCWKIPINESEEAVLEEYLEYLIEHPEIRKIMGENAYAYGREVLGPERIAKQYYDVIMKVNLTEDEK